MMDMQSHVSPIDLPALTKLQSLKTGRLLQLAARLGCFAASRVPDTDASVFDTMACYAANIGLLFQIIDDILDATATPAQLGKSAGQDARHSKTTFVSLLGLDGARDYADTIAAQARRSVSAWDTDGTLAAFAEYLLHRKY
jgi:farnesyl diphosphate synthase